MMKMMMMVMIMALVEEACGGFFGCEKSYVHAFLWRKKKAMCLTNLIEGGRRILLNPKRIKKEKGKKVLFWIKKYIYIYIGKLKVWLRKSFCLIIGLMINCMSHSHTY